MKNTFFALSCLVAVPAFGATSLISINFANKDGANLPDPTVTAANPADVTSSAFSVGTEASGTNGFVEFGAASFDVTGFTEFTTVGINTSNIGNSGFGIGIGTGGVPGLGAWIADSNPNDQPIVTPGGTEFRNNNNGAVTDRLSLSFTQPVMLTQISAGWWDDGGNGSLETWEVVVGGVTASANPASEGSLDLTTTALPQTEHQGVTGVLLLPGETIEFGPGGTDTWDRGAGAPGSDGNLDNGTLTGIDLYVVIPEPGSLMLLSLSVLGLARRRR